MTAAESGARIVASRTIKQARPALYLGRVVEGPRDAAMQQLQTRLAAGDEAAFAELYDDVAPRLHRFLLSRLLRRDAAEEVLQETFVRLAQARAKLGGVRHLPAYVFGIARHEVQRYLASAQRHGQARQDFLEAHAMTAETSRAWESADEAHAALGQLPDQQREVIELKIFGALTFVEIAELLDMPQGTVATRYRTALARMREWLERQDPQPSPRERP